MQWWDSGRTLTVETARFADGLNVGFESKRGFSDDFQGFWHEMEMFMEEVRGKIRREELILGDGGHLNDTPTGRLCCGSGFRRSLC